MQRIKMTMADDGIIFEDTCDFNPAHTFLCGQCFRWDEAADGSFTGIARGKVVNISETDGKVYIKNANQDDFDIWAEYLDFSTDYGQIKSKLSADPHLDAAIRFGGGIRLLNQDPFECLISFIISAQNAIPRIKKIIATMCELFGEKLEFGGKSFYTFPTPERLAALSLDDLAPLRAGYRAAYILEAAKTVATGAVDVFSLHKLPTAEARRELLKIKGVGPKVADCILLFSMKKRDAFPIDVWIARIMRILYLSEGATAKEIDALSREKFGDLGGFAQQYLFFYARENNISEGEAND